MAIDINKHEVEIDTLFKQNELDLCSIKELYRKLKELEKKISQIKYIDSKLTDKLKKDYESLKRVILDENIQLQLSNKINEINSQLDTIEKMNKTNNEIQRKFKPGIGNFLDLNPSGGQMISKDEIDIALSKCKKHGIEKIVIQPWVTWDNSTSILTLKNDLDRLKYIEEKCLEIGLEVACLKLHMYLINFSNVSDKAAFKNQYKNIVQLLCNKFSNSSVNLFIPFNECYVFYKKDSEH